MNPIRGVPAQRDFDNCHFEFSAGIPNGFTRDNLKAPFSAMNIPLYTKEWTAVTVSCYGRNAQSSGNRALDTLNYLRAIWNFSYNRWQGYSWSAPVERPKNRIRIGPVHTVHNPDGTPAGDWFYFEQPFAQSYYPGRADAYGEKELNDLARQEEFYLSPIDKLKYRGEFRSVLREYVSILDTPSSEGGFTRLWKVLEALTATEMADYDTMVTRASAVFRNTQLAHMMVNQLKHARNITTHDMKSAIDSRICFQQALRFVHALLVLHLDYAGEFASFKEVGEFLSLVAAGKDRIAHGRKLSGLAGEVIGQRETWNLSHDYTI